MSPPMLCATTMTRAWELPLYRATGEAILDHRREASAVNPVVEPPVVRKLDEVRRTAIRQGAR